MVLMAKLPSKLLSLASIYHPTAQVHAANDALMVRAYKHMTGVSCHAHTEALLGALGAWLPGFDPISTLVADCGSPGVGPAGGLGQRGVPGLPDLCPPGTPSAQRRMSCGAYPRKYTHHPRCPHLIATLQRVVDDVAMPMWMPSPYLGTSPILIRGPRRTPSGGSGGPCPPGGGVPNPIWRCRTSDHPPNDLGNGAGPRFPSPG